MAKRKRQIEFDSRAIIGIPQSNNQLRLGQVVRRYALGAALMLMFRETLGRLSATSYAAIPGILTPWVCVVTSDDAIASGLWPLLDQRPIQWQEAIRRGKAMNEARLVGVDIINSLIAEDFADALAGLKPWDMYLDPNFFDQWLIPGVNRPPEAFTTKS